MYPQAASTRMALLVGVTLLSLTAATQGIALVAFALGGTPGPAILPFAALAALAFAWWGAGQAFPGQRVAGWVGTAASSLMSVAAAIVLSGQLMDITWDGQWYHTEAIQRLTEGWNPLRESTPATAHPTSATYLGLYTKGPWLAASAIYSLTGNFEQGKAFNLVLMLASGLLAWSALRTLSVARLPALSLALLLALNPISVVQAFTFYVDGQLAALFTCLVALLVIYYRRPGAVALAGLALAGALSINVKLTGALYLAIIGGCGVAWHLLMRRRGGSALATWSVIGCLAGGVVLGYNPYVTQYLRAALGTGNPWHPYDWSVLSLEWQVPRYMVGMGQLERLFYSLFSRAEIMPPIDVPQLKVPFTLSENELQAFRGPDTRTSGFGPWFSGALLVTAPLLVFLPWRRRLWFRLQGAVMVALLAIMITALITTESWWARFVPQLWMIPILCIVLSLVRTRLRWLRLLALLGCAVLFANMSMVAWENGRHAVLGNTDLRTQLATLKQMPSPLVVRFGSFASTRLRFDAAGIRYAIIESELPCAPDQRVTVLFSDTVVCVLP
jgi:hypothetical protein